jgi:2-pyrone-4,6-dicarboxylate lactonase
MDLRPYIRTKVTCPNRRDAGGDPWEDFARAVSPLVEDHPDRALRGADWPHPNMESNIPDDGHLVEKIPRIVVTEEFWQTLLVDNPMRLYWDS